MKIIAKIIMVEYDDGTLSVYDELDNDKELPKPLASKLIEHFKGKEN